MCKFYEVNIYKPIGRKASSTKSLLTLILCDEWSVHIGQLQHRWNSGIVESWSRDITCLLTVYNLLLCRIMEDLGLLTVFLRTCLINTNGDCLGSLGSLGQSWDGHSHLNVPDQNLWKVVYSRPVHECSVWQFSSLSWLCHGDSTVFYVIRAHGRNYFSPCIPL